jgi:predicted Zn-dependent protease
VAPGVVGALVAAGIVTACETVPYTGRSQLQFMSPQQESELGAQAYQQTLAKTKPSSDAAATVGVLLPWSRGPTSRKPTTWDFS